MKSKIIRGIIAISLVICSIAVISCNSKLDSNANSNTESTAIKENDDIENNSDSNNKTNKENESNAILIDNDKITTSLSEDKENTELAKAIIDKLDLDQEAAKETRYYYNYVDLNDDGVKEIFVELVGSYTSGSGGDTAIIFTDNNGKLEEVEEFTLIHNPVIISDEKTNGWKNIIVPKSGGGAKQEYVALKYNGKNYSNVNESNTIDSIDNISGIAIISNDMAKDIEQGKGLYLAK